MSETIKLGNAAGPLADREWAPDLFSLDSRVGGPRERPARLDITGPPRALVFGPYVALPSGIWRAHVRFTVDDAACRRQFRVEWGGLSNFNSHTFVTGQPGIFRIEIDHGWAEETTAEMRLILTEGALDGTVELLGVRVSRVHGPGSAQAHDQCRTTAPASSGNEGR